MYRLGGGAGQGREKGEREMEVGAAGTTETGRENKQVAEGSRESEEGAAGLCVTCPWRLNWMRTIKRPRD